MKLAVLLSALVMAAGCARAPAVSTGGMNPPPAPRDNGAPGSPADRPLEHRLRAEAARWQGTAHRLGGDGPGGMDCSGLVHRIYRDLFRLQLPRTTRTQVKAGRTVPLGRLQPGDLVFFRIPKKKLRHVGIYLGRGEFVHASASRGVTISSLDNPYWQKVFWTARRIL